MSERPSKSLSDLTQSWPEDSANDELARLGQELFATREELPQIALDRIQIRMRREMNRPWWQRRWRTVMGCAVALVAMGIGVHAWNASHPRAVSPDSSPRTDRPNILDRYQVTLPPSSPKPPDKPLIDLQKDGDLFRHAAKEQKR